MANSLVLFSIEVNEKRQHIFLFNSSGWGLMEKRVEGTTGEEEGRNWAIDAYERENGPKKDNNRPDFIEKQFPC